VPWQRLQWESAVPWRRADGHRPSRTQETDPMRATFLYGVG
jgi:hypothetical protein